MLGQRDVHVQLVRLVIDADDLALIHVGLRFDEEVAAGLQPLHGVRGGNAGAVGNHRAVLAGDDGAGPRRVAGGQRGGDAGAARGGQQRGAEADQATGRHGELQTHPAGTVVAHRVHAALAVGHELRDGTHVFLGNVDGGVLHRLVDLAVDGLGDHLRAADGQLEAFAAHLLGEDGQRELATALDFPGVGAVGGQHLDRHVTDELAVETILEHAGGKLVVLAFAAGQRRVVGAEGHRDGRVVDVDERQRLRVVRVDDGLADHDVVDARDGDDVTGAGGFDGSALQALRAQQFDDAEVLDGTVHAGQAVGLALLQRAVVDTDQAESSEEVGGVDVGDVRLQRRALLVFGGGDVLDDVLEQRLKVVVVRQAAVLGLVDGRVAGLRRAVDDRQVKQVVKVEVDAFLDDVLGEAQQQVGGFGDDLFDTGVRTIHLVDAQNHRQLGLKGLAQHETGLRQRAFGSVDEQHDAVDHRDAALDLATEIGVAGGVDDVERDAVRVTVLGRQRTGVFHGRVLGQDGDALLALQIVGVHHTIRHLLALVEHVGLLEHRVYQRGLAVIDVCHDSHITNITANRHRNLS